MSQPPRYDADPGPPHDWEQGPFRTQPLEGWHDQDPARGYDRDLGTYGVGTRDRAFEGEQPRPQPPPGRPTRRGRRGRVRPGPPPGRLLSLVGGLPGRSGVIIVIGSAALGALATVLAGGQPGTAIGLLIIAGTAVGGMVVRPRASYLIIPVPALAYLVAALVAGVINEKAAGASRAALAVGAVQWIAHGFFAMTSATVLAISITAARWWLAVRRDRRRW